VRCVSVLGREQEIARELVVRATLPESGRIRRVCESKKLTLGGTTRRE
jgi:hypothetical protein